MGVILDTSVLIDAERKLLDVSEMLEALRLPRGELVAISAVALMEFANGIALGSSEIRKVHRRQFLEDVRSQIPVRPFGADLAVQAGLLNGELRSSGITVGSLDLMIGVTALALGASVLTRNVRHFRMIPGLDVVEL